ncbi:MAG: hypothetical protein V2I54_11925 [Bacteroidales bacterium]|jgi:hypothetical protein|nr:hypothetical protein [Bacteroidales bacterium]
MKKILIIYYSQSGQLTQIVKKFAKPFEDSDHSVTYATIQPVKDYPFPWQGYDFFDVFPESVYKIPCDIDPLELEHEAYDLIVLAYTVWYMSPSIPFNSFLLSDQAKRIIRGKPVVTLLGVRNMWVVAQEYVKEKISSLGGHLVANICLHDRAENLTGIVTISYFLFSGKKERLWGIFPKPGISEKDIAGTETFGKVVLDHFHRDQLNDLQDELIKIKAVPVKPYLLSLEKTAARVFKIWASFMLKKGGPEDPARRFRVNLFRGYFPVAIALVAPLKYIFYILLTPFFFSRRIKEKRYYTQVKQNK